MIKAAKILYSCFVHYGTTATRALPRRFTPIVHTLLRRPPDSVVPSSVSIISLPTRQTLLLRESRSATAYLLPEVRVEPGAVRDLPPQSPLLTVDRSFSRNAPILWAVVLP